MGVTCPEVIEESGSIRRMIRNAHRPRSVRAAPPSALVIGDQPVAAGQGRLRQERQEAVSQDRTDEQHGFSFPGDVEFQVGAIHTRTLQGRWSHYHSLHRSDRALFIS